MYVTRPLSQYINNPNSLSSPPDGPNSGYLVVQDVDYEAYCCFFLCKSTFVDRLPFPQNKKLTAQYTTGTGQHQRTSSHEVAFIPVLNQPLSAKQYYAIELRGSHKGEAYTSSTEEDMVTCCFCRCIRDVKSRSLDPNDTYQQYEIAPVEGCCGSATLNFTAKSVAPGGFPPSFLTKSWRIYNRTPKNYELDEAPGINAALRSRLPEFSVPISSRSSKPVVVGKWYSPFMFIKEGSLRDQVKKSMYYEITLERKWEQIFSTENNIGSGNSILMDVPVQKEAVFIDGREAIWDDKEIIEGSIWFTSLGRGNGGEQISVGLRTEIVERMRWEEERVGWIGGEERQVRVERMENFGGLGGWSRFGCYVLVESFLLKRIDGSLVMTYDFRHMNEIQSRWE